MPIFEYICPQCGNTGEYIVFPVEGEEPTVFCNACSNEDVSVAMNKVPSISNFHLKGDGWAKDGYSKKV